MFHTVHMFYNFIMFHTVDMFYNFNLGLFGIFLSYWVVFFKLDFYILWKFLFSGSFTEIKYFYFGKWDWSISPETRKMFDLFHLETLKIYNLFYLKTRKIFIFLLYACIRRRCCVKNSFPRTGGPGLLKPEYKHFKEKVLTNILKRFFLFFIKRYFF